MLGSMRVEIDTIPGKLNVDGLVDNGELPTGQTQVRITIANTEQADLLNKSLVVGQVVNLKLNGIERIDGVDVVSKNYARDNFLTSRIEVTFRKKVAK